jgi:hypothetical protein
MADEEKSGQVEKRRSNRREETEIVLRRGNGDMTTL